jgi:hypothetical protein
MTSLAVSNGNMAAYAWRLTGVDGAGGGAVGALVGGGSKKLVPDSGNCTNGLDGSATGVIVRVGVVT